MEVHRRSIDIQASYLGVKMESTPGKGVKRKLYETDFEDDFPDWQQSLILEMSLEKLQAAQEPLKKYKPCIKDTVSVEHPLRRTVLLENTIKRIKMYMPEDVYNATEMRTFNTFLSHSSQYPGIGTFISPMTPVPVAAVNNGPPSAHRGSLKPHHHRRGNDNGPSHQTTADGMKHRGDRHHQLPHGQSSRYRPLSRSRPSCGPSLNHRHPQQPPTRQLSPLSDRRAAETARGSSTLTYTTAQQLRRSTPLRLTRPPAKQYRRWTPPSTYRRLTPLRP
ncbi:hypothetical protein ACOMHN_040450 [Nucella lapillus]